MIKIQSHLHEQKNGSYRSAYWMKDGENPSKRISDNKFWELYDRIFDGGVEILAPITHEYNQSQ